MQNAGLNDSDLFLLFQILSGLRSRFRQHRHLLLFRLIFWQPEALWLRLFRWSSGAPCPRHYLGTLTLTDNDFPTETVAKMNITFIVESSVSGVVDAVVQTITNAEIANSVIPSENYIFSAFVCATDTVNDIFEVQLRVREWRYDDPITPLATHTITILGSTLNQNLEKWFA